MLQHLMEFQFLFVVKAHSFDAITLSHSHTNTHTHTRDNFREHGPINPILDSTWTFLESFLKEVFQVFPDEYFHVGGDEVDFPCWQVSQTRYTLEISFSLHFLSFPSSQEKQSFHQEVDEGAQTQQVLQVGGIL